MAAGAAAAGMPAYVFVPYDLERAKIVASAAYGARVVSVRGTYDDVNRLCAEVADEEGWGFVNVNLRPFYAEGSKTIGYEIAEQLGWRLPDHVVAPLASGSLFTKLHQAFGELRRYGLVDSPQPRLSGGQASGCSPIAEAFARGDTDVRPQRPDTVARSLAIGSPADGHGALRTARETGGAIGHVPDDEIVAAMGILARTEGILAETAGGVTIATLARLVENGTVDRDERVVAVVTGNGYKTLESIEPSVDVALEMTPSLPHLRRVLAGDPRGA